MGWLKSGDTERIDKLERRIAHLESVVEMLANKSGVAVEWAQPMGISAKEHDLVARGKKIEAIKAYRERTGAGLMEAKNVIDSIG
ncbi:ribosomal protein L7/L12 [Enemella sp. A6]|uniref:ribosomal protein L7/L12 n=1 Tax=Enemella sp. A6 TaxID=3440152 RepID=UPI003EBFFF43